MSNRATSRDATGSGHPLPLRAHSLPEHGERRAAEPEHPSTPSLGGRGVGAMRDTLIRAHLADSKVAIALYDLIMAGHNLNRWDLTDAAVNALCEAAARYIGERDRALAERGMNHE